MNEQWKGLMRHDVYSDAFGENVHLMKKWTETWSILPRNTYYAFHWICFLVSFPLREKVSSIPLVNLVWHKGNDKSNRCYKPLFLMHSVIESEYSVYTDDIPDALTAEIMIRKIQIMPTSIILSHSIIQFSFLQPVLSFLLNYSVLS